MAKKSKPVAPTGDKLIQCGFWITVNQHTRIKAAVLEAYKAGNKGESGSAIVRRGIEKELGNG